MGMFTVSQYEYQRSIEREVILHLLYLYLHSLSSLSEITSLMYKYWIIWIEDVWIEDVWSVHSQKTPLFLQDRRYPPLFLSLSPLESLRSTTLMGNLRKLTLGVLQVFSVTCGLRSSFS